MLMHRSGFACLLALGGCALTALGAEPVTGPYPIPDNVFAGEARGPYKTGTFEELWIDAQRDETTTSDPVDKRHLMVQFWYPASFEGDPPRARYALHRELYPHDEDARWLDEVKSVRTTSVLNASVAQSAQPFPVLIYNPGAEHPPFSGTFQTEFLASHGYVVVAIGHTDVTRIERFPDGSHYKADLGRTVLEDNAADSRLDVTRFEALAKKYAHTTMRIHLQDIAFVLDKLAAMNGSRSDRFYRRLDLERVGALGWSLGGVLALQASRDEPRIKASVNLDGWLYTDVQETGTHQPILQMHSGGLPSARQAQTAADRALALVAQSKYWQVYARTDADWYDVTLERAEHENFSDRTLFEVADPQVMYPGLAHEIVNRFALEFFDKYLRHSANTPLLSGEQAYPEVTLVKHAHLGHQCTSLVSCASE
jgi:dienelactone hydrolase